MMLIGIILGLSVQKIVGSPLTQISSRDDVTQSICTTPECIQTAAYILKSTNSSADPCQDFYSFVCGKFIENTIVPGHKKEYNQFVKINDKINKELKMVLEEPIQKNEIKPFKFAKTMYQSCMNTDELETNGTANMLQLIEAIGGWPVVNKEEDQMAYWNQPNFSWIDLEQDMKKFGLQLNTIMSLTLTSSHDNSSIRVITIDQPELGITREHLVKGFEDNEVQIYYNYMVSLATALGADFDKAKSEMKEVMEFEIQLANISLPAEQRRFGMALISPISGLEILLPILPWLTYISGVLGPDIKVDQNETVTVRSIHYTVKLSELLKTVKPRTVANFMIFKGVSSLTRYMTKDIRDIRNKFTADYYDLESTLPPWEDCMSMMTNNVPLILGALYVRHFLSHHGKEEAQNIVESIVSQFNKGLDEIDWMDEETKIKAKQKANNTLTFVGYPDELLNDTVLAEYYENISYWIIIIIISPCLCVSFFEFIASDHKIFISFHYASTFRKMVKKAIRYLENIVSFFVLLLMYSVAKYIAWIAVIST